MIMTVFGGIAEFERSLILTRTKEGRDSAKTRGVTFGRPGVLKPDQRKLARELVEEGKSIAAVARTFNVHPATIYRALGENQLRSTPSDRLPLFRISESLDFNAPVYAGFRVGCV